MLKRLMIMGLGLLTIPHQLLLAKPSFGAKVIESAKHAMVTLFMKPSLEGPGGAANSWKGTGFVVDNKKGYIVTYAHPFRDAPQEAYYLRFYDGTEVATRVWYCDPWLDYALLTVEPSKIPVGVTKVEPATKGPYLDQPVFMVDGSSVYQGDVKSLCEIAGTKTQHTILVGLDKEGSSLGSPIFDRQGKLLGMHMGGSNATVLGLHPRYLSYVIGFFYGSLEKGKLPVRRHVGVLTRTYSLDDAVKNHSFPVEKCNRYNQKYPEAQGKVIQVAEVLPGSTADGILVPGDIIWKVNNSLLKPDYLYYMDFSMDIQKFIGVSLTIYREGKRYAFSVPVYDLADSTMKPIPHDS